MLTRISSCYDSLVLGKPKLVLALLFIIFIFFSYFVKDFKLDASSDSLMLENDEDLRIFREVSDRYKTRELLFVTFTPNEDLFSDTALAHIKSLRDELAQLSRVESAITILDVPLVKIIGGKLSEVAKNFRTLEDPTVDRAKAKAELLESMLQGHGDHKLGAIKRDIHVVHESFPISDLFDHLLEKREHIVLVVDEYGGMSGICTMEDVMETLLGMEITDESDSTVDMQVLARKNWEKRARRFGLIGDDAE